jgi:hypothetical protein
LKFTPEKFAEGALEVINLANKLSSRPDLLWLTNIPTPYRIPTWQILNSSLKFYIKDLHLSVANPLDDYIFWNAYKQLRDILYETERRYKNAVRDMIDVRGGLADARAKAGHAEIDATELKAMQAWVLEGKTDHAPGSIASVLN